MSTDGRRLCTVVTLCIAVLTTASCAWGGVNSISLPGGQGRGPGAYQVSIDMPNVTTITPNSPVLVNDVNVGRITAIRLQDWHARVDVSLNKDVELPENAVAAIGQTSLLGSQHIELAPPSDVGPVGRLRPGDVIPIDRASGYPTTEQTLSALSVVLNGGGLARVGDIVRGANDALDGRTDTTRDLLKQLTQLTSTLDKRRSTIVTALNGLDGLSSVIGQQNAVLDKAIAEISPAVEQLSARRSQLSEVLTALDQFGQSASAVIDTSAKDIKENVANLHPVLKQLADSGKSLTDTLDLLFTFPFPISKLDRIVRGDYANLFVILDLSVPRLRSDLLRGTPLGRNVSGPGGVLGEEPRTAGQRTDPLTDPVTVPSRPVPGSEPDGGN